MKSIQNQYIDLKEGRMSQANFMRNVRMTLPQYVTNVTSFKDAVRILKNKAILNEAIGGDPIEATLKSYLAKGYSYAEAIELTAAEQGMDEEVLMSQYPQDAVDTEGYEDEGDDDEFIDMIARAEEEEAGKYTKFDDFEGGLSEAENTSLRNPNMAAKIVAQKHNAKLQAVQSDFKQFEREAIQLAGEEMLASGMDKVAIRNLLSGYGSFEDWISDYIDTLTAELDNPEEEAPEDYEDPDMFDAYGMDASEGKINEGRKKKEPKAELHPNQIHPQELRMGIKVELEHTDDLDKAKKIALDHLAENPFYYTALKLSGIESPSAPKVKPPVEKKAKKKKEAVEMVDAANQMQKVKMPKVVKESLNEGGEWTITGTLTKDEQDELKGMIGDYELDVQATDDTLETTISHPMYNDKTLEHALKQVRGMLPQKKQVGHTVGFDNVLQSKLEALVREVMSEMFDGRDDMNAQNEY